MMKLIDALELVIDLAAQSVDEEQGEIRDGQEAACDAVEAFATMTFGKAWRQTPTTGLFADGMRLRGLLAEASDEIEFLAASQKQPSDLVDRIRAALDATD